MTKCKYGIDQIDESDHQIDSIKNVKLKPQVEET